MDFKNKGSYKKRTPFTLGDPNNAVMSIVTVNIIFFLLILISFTKVNKYFTTTIQHLLLLFIKLLTKVILKYFFCYSLNIIRFPH